MGKGRATLLRGMKDVLPEDMKRRLFLEDSAFRTCRLFGYKQVETPIVETEELYKRSLGSSSDVVQKEMFDFDDKSGTRVSLRPEGTAGLARMVTANEYGLFRNLPHRFFYSGPMFRYERPQKGRQRQFQQIGVECFGESSPLADAEVIIMAKQFLDAANLTSPPKLLINSLGDSEDRERYQKALQDFLSSVKDQLSPDSKQRLEKGAVLRVLDSKEPMDHKLLASAPVLTDYLGEQSRSRYEKVLAILQESGVLYHQEPKLVRGLDYYSHTVFEFISDTIGAQSAVLAGGRYDNLAQIISEQSVTAVGWAAGVDRLALSMAPLPSTRNVCLVIPVIPRQDQEKRDQSEIMDACFHTSMLLRRNGISTYLPLQMKPSAKIIRRAEGWDASVAIFIGESEVSNGSFVLKDLATHKETKVESKERLLESLDSLRGRPE